ncbi:MAG TPA: PD-(D/E)XK nuclease family protein [Candidatus Nanoarchaeia archaeon]|nr:PD-(D/E)XK nuclease family protein [Candidatus Nanoarchaeia archaeon]
MPERIQSPSSINTYKQCPRKYYYQYIVRLDTKPSIHLLRGEIVHRTLEDFFQLTDIPASDYALRFQVEALGLLKKHWHANILTLSQLESDEALEFYLHESQLMLVNITNVFTKRFEKELRKGIPAGAAFQNITPKVEEEFISHNLKVRGYIDAIESGDDGIRIMDYKTSKITEINDSYRLQLAIYALLYEEKHGRKPDKVGIYFLKASERLLDVTDDMLHFARKEIEQIHKNTKSDEMKSYPMKPSRLCNWGNGKCDFYDLCYENDKEYEKLLKIKH